MEEDININYTAIIVATIANFIFGFLWYTPLFGKAWARELKFDTSIKPKASVMMRGMIFGIIGNFFLAFVLAHNNAAWSYVPGMKGIAASTIVANSAIFTWLGFFLPVDLSRVAWEGASWRLFGINTAYHLLSLVIAATILTLMS